MLKKATFLLTFLFIIILISCDNKTELEDRVVIGISADVNTFNPLFAFSVDEGNVSELLYLSLADFRWNKDLGDLEAFPMLARSWEWASDSSFIIFHLRDDVKWSDGVPLTAEDVVFSLDVYSDPVVNSRLYGIFEDLYTDNENHINIEKTFKIISPYELQINFIPGSSPELIDIVHPLIPKHIFGKIKREDLETSDANFNPVTSSPFILKKWDKNQSITLEANKSSFLYTPGNVNELVFKIIPDYTSRLTQLKKGEIDLMELISTEDIEDIKDEKNLHIETVDGREYDYIGWNNIDPDIYVSRGKIKPNKLFGNKEIRIALTYAINRQEILSEYLYNYGELAASPISPIFTSYYNPNIQQYEYDPEKAKNILTKEGWVDSDNDGVIDKDGLEFKFTLTIPSGNPLRPYAATVIKNNLKAVGIEMDFETLELGAFIDKRSERKIYAWMAGWYVPIPIELKAFWYSDLQSAQLNFASYQNEEADKIMDELTKHLPPGKKKELYYQFQNIIHEDQPFTFMYWISNIVGINKRVKHVSVDPIGVITNCWEWSTED